MSETDGGQTKKDATVYSLARPSRCYGCDQKLLSGDIVKFKHGTDEREVLCRACAGLQDFQLLPGGNAQATRLATKYSSLRYVVLRWSELWKTYERQGILVESEALDRVERELGIKVRNG